MKEKLSEQVLEVIIFFDLLNYPLTFLEIGKYLSVMVLAKEIKEVLDQLIKENKVQQSEGYYFLGGREVLVSQRKMRYALAGDKMIKARYWARVLSFLPFVRAVAVYSSLALLNSRADGDIDFFIVAQKGRIWTARFFVNSLLKICGLRPTASISQNKICASYWVDESHLDLSAVNKGQKDFFYLYGDANFYFLAGLDVAKKYFLDNQWIKANMPNWQLTYPAVSSEFQIKIRAWLEKMANWIKESFFNEIQMRILPERYKKIMNQDTRVVINQFMIKLHDNDKSEEYNKEMNNCLFKIKNDEKVAS
ncbi:MAG: hypothetical protein WCL61_03650 [bacterium]